MLIYRMENSKGRGPFATRLTVNPFAVHPKAQNELGFALFPTPQEEGLPITPEHRCGCSNPRQFLHWFPRPVRKLLKTQGFKPVVYEIPDNHVIHGEHQVIYVDISNGE